MLKPEIYWNSLDKYGSSAEGNPQSDSGKTDIWLFLYDNKT